MRKLFLLALLTLPAAAQQTVTIPAPDGKTITSANGVWSCGGSGLPAGIGWDGTTLTVPQISLTGGPTHPDGLYMASIKANVITWTPYVAPVSSGAAPTYQSITIPATLSVGPSSVVKLAFISPAGKFLSVYPQSNPGDQWAFDVLPGLVRVRNTGYTRANFPATVVLVEAR